jgi:nucleoid-associated protein YgaU
MDAGANGTYTVKKGDTLMWIAFKIYGDYSKWSDLSGQNGNIVRISEGQVLNYTEPSERFTWDPKGNPHTVVSGDTLGTISKEKYGTAMKWRSIFDNNRPMIKDPNLIFAGFTLYYIPGRDLASE